MVFCYLIGLLDESGLNRKRERAQSTEPTQLEEESEENVTCNKLKTNYSFVIIDYSCRSRYSYHWYNYKENVSITDII
jgi:hypothetical protein